ncbi:MAG: hypothetical protein AAFV43_09940 [Planctomycetota bacterium]
MADQFDPYREALVVEQVTHWPSAVRDLVSDWSDADRERLARRLHANPAEAVGLQYVRVHTGFCRRVTVTADDLERLSKSTSSGETG